MLCDLKKRKIAEILRAKICYHSNARPFLRQTFFIYGLRRAASGTLIAYVIAILKEVTDFSDSSSHPFPAILVTRVGVIF